MKDILRQIADILYEMPKMSKQRMIGILNPLKTEQQEKEMLNYLQENKDNKELMRIDNLMRKTIEIGNRK